MLTKVNSFILLSVGLILIISIVWFILRANGGFSSIRKRNKNNKRVMLEDALKFIFDCEYNNINCEVNSIAGNLNINIDKAGQLINRLLSMELVKIENLFVSLTDTGRSYALRIVRIHRILEKYLADETSVEPTEWHKEACRIEHLVTVEDAEKLAAQIGHPVFDPHGDPIPTIDGKLPNKKGKNLSAMKAGEKGRIIHLEDEPKSIYEQLVVLGLYPGMPIYVTNVSAEKITFVADGDECSLTPLFASSVTIGELESEPLVSKHDLLSSLHIGEFAEITGISPNCRGQQRRRLLDLGFVPGSRISAVIRSASGDPVGYRVLNTTIGIRKRQADLIFIKRNN